MTTLAVVKRVAPSGFVDLEFDAAARCEGCSGLCLWRRPESRPRARIAAGGAFEPGQRVVVSLPERAVLVGGLVLHGLPWAALVAGALVGGVLFGSDWGVLAGAATSMSGVVFLMPRLRRRVEARVLAALSIRGAEERSA